MTTLLALLPEIAFTIEGITSRLRVVGLEGREAISELFRFEVTLALEEEAAPLGDVLGARGELRLEVGARSRAIHGVVSRFEQGDSGGPLTTYRATLSPAAYVLSLRRDCRMFQEQTAPEIIESVLRAAGFSARDSRFFLHGTYRPREHCVQYRETDWAFLLRLLEAEGIFCYFDHEDGREVLVFADTPFVHRRLAEPSSLSFKSPGGALQTSGEHVRRFRFSEEMRPGRVMLRGHSFERPDLPLESATRVAPSAITIHDAPPAFDAPEVGDGLARLRMEQEEASCRTADVESGCPQIQPGILFGLREHSNDALNRDWLVTSAEHKGTFPIATGSAEPATYSNRFVCIPSDVPFRSQSRAARPIVRGVQTAVVVGPPGEDIHCDDLGRVKVQFHWDREGRFDDRSSSWIRVSQAWAGRGYGALFTPRVGHQVLVDFVDGDPDRPIIVGSVYDGTNLPPASLPQQRTSTAIRSSSSPGGDGQSELRFEDQRGREHVYLGSYRDLGIGVGQDKDETVARNESLEVGGDSDKTIGGAETLTIGMARAVAVAGPQSVSVGLDEIKTVGGESKAVIEGNRALEVGGDRSIRVIGNQTEVVGEHLALRVGANKTEKVTGSSRESVEGERAVEAGRYSLDVHEKMRTTVEGDHEENAAGGRRISAGEIVELVCGEATITAHKDGTITLVGKQVRVKVVGPVEVEGEKLSVKSTGSVTVSAGGSVKVRGRGVNLN